MSKDSQDKPRYFANKACLARPLAFLQPHPRQSGDANAEAQSLNLRRWEIGGYGYGEPNAISNAIDYAKFYSRSHDAVVRVYDDTGDLNLSRASCCFYSSASKVLLVRHAAPHVEIAFATIKGNQVGRNRQRIPVVVLDNRQETLPKRHHAQLVVKL
jgi:hypothetical protein